MKFNRIGDSCRQTSCEKDCLFYGDGYVCYFNDLTPNLWDEKFIKEQLDIFYKGWPTRKELFLLMFPTASFEWCPSKYSDNEDDNRCNGHPGEEGEWQCGKCREDFWNTKVDIRKFQQ